MIKYEYPTAFSYWGKEEYAAIQRVLDSNWFTMGPEVEAFEDEFARFHNRHHCIMVNSGSSANLIAVAAMVEAGLIQRGDTALVPAVAWSTTYAPLVQYGLNLHLIDCDATWNAEKWYPVGIAKLAVGCSILGNPAHLPWWREHCKREGMLFIEDNCESLGASIGGELCGTFGLLSTFSFFHSHQISAIEGGAILTDDDTLAKLCRILRAHGWTRDVRTSHPPFGREYEFTAFGYNVRPLEMHAAIAREQLKKLPAFIAARRTNRSLFWDMASGINITRQEPNGWQSPFGITFRVDGQRTRERLVTALRMADIDCRLPTGGSFLAHPYASTIKTRGYGAAAARLHETGLFLGNAPYDIEPQLARAVTCIRALIHG